MTFVTYLDDLKRLIMSIGLENWVEADEISIEKTESNILK